MQWKLKSGSSTLPVIQSFWCWPEGGSPLLLFHGSRISASSGPCSELACVCPGALQTTHSVSLQTCVLCQHPWHWHKARGERGSPRHWHQCQKANLQVNLWRWASSEPALNTGLWKKLAQQLASLSNPLCTSLGSARGLSDPFAGIPKAQGTDIHPVVAQLQLPNCSRILSEYSEVQQKAEPQLPMYKNMEVCPKIPQTYTQLTNPLFSLCLVYWQNALGVEVCNWFSLLPELSFIENLTF